MGYRSIGGPKYYYIVDTYTKYSMKKMKRRNNKLEAQTDWSTQTGDFTMTDKVKVYFCLLEFRLKKLCHGNVIWMNLLKANEK